MKRKLSILLLLVSMMILSVVSHDVEASTQVGRDISKEAVKELSLSTNEINDGGNITVNLSFDESVIEIQPNDYISVAWESEGIVFINGYSKSIPLYIKVKYVADAKIETTGATIKFNDNINNMDEVTGWVSFEIMGRNISPVKEKDTKATTIWSGNISKDILISKGEAGENSVFYYKTGNMSPEDTEHITWWLSINYDGVELGSGVRLEDRVQEGHQIVEDSILFTIKNSDTQSVEYLDKTQFMDAYPNSIVDLDTSLMSMDIVLEKGMISNRSITVMYQTMITEKTQATFTNHSKIWYQEVNQESIDGEVYNWSVNNINVSGGIDGIQSIDVSKSWNGESLESITVHLLADGEIIQSAVLTEENGWKHTFNNLQVDSTNRAVDYTVLEESLEGYRSEVSGNTLEGFIITNHELVSIPVEKKWVGKALEEVEIKLYANLEEVDRIFLSEENNWKHVFGQLDKYRDGEEINYTIEETQIEGYRTSVEGNSEEGFMITNVELLSIPVQKIWIGNVQPQIKLRLLADGKQVADTTLTENDGWNYIFADLNKYDDGKEILYTIVEDDINGYESRITGSMEEGFIVVNVQKTNRKPIGPEIKPNPKDPGSTESPKVEPNEIASTPKEVTVLSQDKKPENDDNVNTGFDMRIFVPVTLLIGSGLILGLKLVKRKNNME